MLKRGTIFLASLLVIAAAVVLSGQGPGRADRPDTVADYQPVADWPRLPDTIKFGQVTAVATDSADRVHVFHRGKNPIVVFDAAGKYLRSWGDDLVKNAHGLRIDRDDNVWITDLAHHQVMKFDSGGKLLLTLGKKGKPGETKDQFNKPADVGFGSAGEIYVADGYGNSRVVKFSKEGNYLLEWGKKGKGEGEFNLPHALRIDDRGRVYVGDRENNRIQVFDADGKFLAQWKDTGAPFGLFLTPDKHMLLADGRANRAKVLDLEGKALGHWGEKGARAGQFNFPHGICMDSRGAVYVAEIDGQRVQKFTAR
jgi:DNA-binding beta-propeller fold protein YncE